MGRGTRLCVAWLVRLLSGVRELCALFASGSAMPVRGGGNLFLADGHVGDRVIEGFAQDWFQREG